MFRTALVFVLAGLAYAAGAEAAAATKHSGTIVSVDQQRRLIRIDEVGPWVGPKHGIVSRTIRLTPDTTVDLVGRSPKTSPRPGGFVTSPPTTSALRPGDGVTITVVRRAGRLVATAIEVVRAEGPPEEAPR